MPLYMRQSRNLESLGVERLTQVVVCDLNGGAFFIIESIFDGLTIYVGGLIALKAIFPHGNRRSTVAGITIDRYEASAGAQVSFDRLAHLDQVIKILRIVKFDSIT